MNRTTYLTREFLCSTFLLLLALLANSTNASEQGVQPNQLWVWVGATDLPSPEAAFAYMNQKRAEWYNAPPATDLQACPGVNWINDNPVEWCFHEPGTPNLVGSI